MTARAATAAFVLLAGALAAAPRASAPPSEAVVHVGHRHHYRMSARVRPLLFWIGKDDVGDAIVATRHDGDATEYSLLIGSDPDRAPRRINRWGYIDEEIRGSSATLVGLMTESDEESVGEAEASLRKQAGQHVFNIIHASVTEREARSVVTSVAAPADYTFRQVDTLLGLAGRTPAQGTTRVIQFPEGTRPGFLVALADVVHAQVQEWRASQRLVAGDPVAYVYHGKLYQLRVARTRPLSNVHIDGTAYDHAIASQMQVKETRSGELTDFLMTYAADGPSAETLLSATYRPRWWFEVQLTLDDRGPEGQLARRHP